MRYNINISKFLLGAFITSAVLLSACNKDETISKSKYKGESSDKVTFGITRSQKWMADEIGGTPVSASGANTKAISQTEMIPMDVEGGELGTQIYMYMIEEDVPQVIDTVQTSTKAEAATFSNIGLYAYQVPAANYNSEVYKPETAGVTVFMDNMCLKSDGSYSGDDKYWPGSSALLQFYAYYPYHNPKTDGKLAVQDAPDSQVPGLTITTAGNKPVFSYTVPTDPLKQTDLMDGGSSLINGALTNQVQISLSHLLSQIEVKAGTLDEGLIKSITFTNIYNKGDRIIATPTSEGWTIDENDSYKVDYEFELNLDINASKDQLNSNPSLIPTMYLMPQTLRDDAQIKIELSVTSINPHSTDPDNPNRIQEYELSKQLNQFVSNWSPNKKYTYILSTPEEVEVIITDKVNGNVKSDLKIMNCGLSDIYVRATFVGSWVIPNETETYDDDVSVADWDPTGNGVFAWGSDNLNNEPTTTAVTGWRKHTDGYYYHLNPLKRGAETAKLFDTYTLTSSPVAGAVLDFTIVVQAVLATDVTYAWPKEITDNFVQVAFIRQ